MWKILPTGYILLWVIMYTWYLSTNNQCVSELTENNWTRTKVALIRIVNIKCFAICSNRILKILIVKKIQVYEL